MTVVPGDLDPFAVDVQKLAAQEKPAKKAAAKGREVATK
jgi:hypothetical protein